MRLEILRQEVVGTRTQSDRSGASPGGWPASNADLGPPRLWFSPCASSSMSLNWENTTRTNILIVPHHVQGSRYLHSVRSCRARIQSASTLRRGRRRRQWSSCSGRHVLPTQRQFLDAFSGFHHLGERVSGLGPSSISGPSSAREEERILRPYGQVSTTFHPAARTHILTAVQCIHGVFGC